jgi:hypothetical protein
MAIFHVRDGRTRAILWTGAATDATRALEAAAQAAGYLGFEALPAELRERLVAEHLSV